MSTQEDFCKLCREEQTKKANDMSVESRKQKQEIEKSALLNFINVKLEQTHQAVFTALHKH
jgi:hypothetical protein